MRNIVIVDPVSTAYNFVEDVVRRGYQPVVLTSKVQKDGTLEELRQEGAGDTEESQDISAILYKDFWHQLLFLEEQETYGCRSESSGKPRGISGCHDQKECHA